MTSDVKTESATVDTNVLLEFMYRLAQALLACGEQTSQVELLLRRIASAYGMRRSRVVTFPTAVFIFLDDGTGERVTLAEGPSETLRLDQIADVYALGAAAGRGEGSPAEGIERLNEIMRKKPRFGALGMVVGHATLTAGLAMILSPSLINVAGACVLGAIVGVFKLINQNRPVLAVPIPIVAAGLVSALSFFAFNHGFPVDPVELLIPPLVTFLPGAMLTLGMLELAYGDMVSGSSRLLTGLVHLVLLAFGLAAGAALAGYTPSDLVDTGADLVKARWVPWAGVLVFGIGVYLHFSAPSRALGWMLIVLLSAFLAQRVAAEFLGTAISGFFGTLVATPLGYFIHLRFKGPPPMVTFLPSFWLLVPGALGLVSMTMMLSDRTAGLENLVTAVFAMTSIALGTLVGASLYKALTERFGWWRLQVGRVGTYMRRRRG